MQPVAAVATAAPPPGLTSADVAARVSAGKVNVTDDTSSRSLGEILRGNLFTLFNAILGTALVVVLAVGAWKDAVFGFVLLFNTLIGAVTEYRAKRTLDRLAILNQSEVTVIRDGAELRVPMREVVLDEVMRLTLGDQVPADGEVLTSSGLEVDESMLTGESEPVDKAPGDPVLSGSAVVAGAAVVRATRVGQDAYAQKLTSQVKQFSLVGSELRNGINKVLVVISWVIVPIAFLLFWSQIRNEGGFQVAFAGDGWRDAVVQAVAGIVGMVPEGLVLLTSINFALAAVILARRRVLIQELPAVEVLARVDVLCLDKTGTITDGSVELDELVELEPVAGARELLAAVAREPDASPSAAAIAPGLADVATVAQQVVVPFSSARKWSGHRAESGTWVLGAPEVLLASRAADDGVVTRVLELATSGARVLLLAHVPGEEPLDHHSVPEDLRPALLAVLRERVRPDAAETLAYFAMQDVEVKVISGDNPATVGRIADSVGLQGGAGIDARTLPKDRESLRVAMREGRVFGRVSPEQKRAFVHALQDDGRTVAMTGDGVNDALALKEADLGIAMGNGAAATKAVARVVLLDGTFSTLPGVVAEGRRVIANMERVAALFLTKTTYAVLLAVVVALVAWPYPFLPRHLTLVGALTIGTPAFFLALAPNNQRYRKGFLDRVLQLAVPCGLICGSGVLVVYGTLHLRGETLQASTGATLTLILMALWLLAILARPWSWWRLTLVAAMALGAVLAVGIPFVRDFFALEWPAGPTAQLIVVVGVIGAGLIELVYRLRERRSARIGTSSADGEPVPER
ncbi:HAD-IC family P-type ATPase [Pseudactinotalea suaedae]|uniref:HAD-IC family P-type ATPase n=1 Tax=Pseudactinotalea suaedae TaxID=1524924 RepID=UPI0012E22FF2|nr:HAD-IC family P-type ATPase [Pseudactinotalea suaedae]